MLCIITSVVIFLKEASSSLYQKWLTHGVVIMYAAYLYFNTYAKQT
jgi:hypothetical protein